MPLQKAKPPFPLLFAFSSAQSFVLYFGPTENRSERGGEEDRTRKRWVTTVTIRVSRHRKERRRSDRSRRVNRWISRSSRVDLLFSKAGLKREQGRQKLVYPPMAADRIIRYIGGFRFTGRSVNLIPLHKGREDDTSGRIG